MEENTRGFILKQIQNSESTMNKYKDTPHAPEYKAALKSFTTFTAELRKGEELDLKKAESEFERETKRKSEEHRFEMEQKDFELREYETYERINTQKRETDLKEDESRSWLKRQGTMETIKWVHRIGVLTAAYIGEAYGLVLPLGKLGLGRKLSD